MRAVCHFLLFALICCPGFGAEKTSARQAVKGGITTPGVQIPFTSLKPETEISIGGKPSGAVFADQVFITVPEANQIVSIDPKKNEKGAKPISIEKPCGGIIRAFGNLWVPNCQKEELARIDQKSGEIKATIATGVSGTSDSLVSTPDSIWLLADQKTSLLRIDPDDNIVIGEIRLPEGCNSITSGDSALWVTCPKESKILRINPQKNIIEKQIEVSSQPVSVTFGEGSVWVFCQAEGKVVRINPKENKILKTIDLNVPNAIGSISYGEGFIWVSMAGFPVSRIVADTDEVAQQFHGTGGGYLAIGSGSLWLAAGNGQSLLKIDPKRALATLAE